MICWRILTIVFGALPATFISMFAVMGISYGVVHFFVGLMSNDLQWIGLGFLTLVWGSLGVYGTISLWAVGSGFVSKASMNGLKTGVIAILPLGVAYLADVFGGCCYGPELLWELWLVLAPLITACTWLLIPKQRRGYMTDPLADLPTCRTRFGAAQPHRQQIKTGPSATKCGGRPVRSLLDD